MEINEFVGSYRKAEISCDKAPLGAGLDWCAARNGLDSLPEVLPTLQTEPPVPLITSARNTQDFMDYGNIIMLHTYTTC